MKQAREFHQVTVAVTSLPAGEGEVPAELMARAVATQLPLTTSKPPRTTSKAGASTHGVYGSC